MVGIEKGPAQQSLSREETSCQRHIVMPAEERHPIEGMSPQRRLGLGLGLASIYKSWTPASARETFRRRGDGDGAWAAFDFIVHD